jgi:hypothetical protein
MSMYRIIGADQKEYGPVAAEQVRRWLAEGRVNGQTLVQPAGATEWKPLASFAEFGMAPGAQPGQRPPESAPPPPPEAASETAEILARELQLEVGRCLVLSWDLMMGNLGLLLGATFLIWLVSLCQFIPFGGLIYAVFAGALYGGLYLVYLKRIRGSPAAVGDAFAGFSLALAQLILAGFVSNLLSGIGLIFCVVPYIYLKVAWVFSVPLVADKRLEFWSAMELSRKVVTQVWFKMFGLVVIAFSPTLLVSLGVGLKILLTGISIFQDAFASGPPDMERLLPAVTQISRTSLSLGLVTKVVLLLNLPFALGALMYAYESLFGARATRNP